MKDYTPKHIGDEDKVYSNKIQWDEEMWSRERISRVGYKNIIPQDLHKTYSLSWIRYITFSIDTNEKYSNIRVDNDKKNV